MTSTEGNTAKLQVSVIIPARNEEANLGACLESVTAQSGVNFEVIVVDDHSTDRTRDIARSFPAVKVIEAGPLPAGWTGKNNAVATGARVAQGDWLLFTDADTVHLAGSLKRALNEVEASGADLLSYSPEQIAVTFWEMAVLPVVFAELAREYPPSKVSNPDSPEAAANGQYLLVKRDAYEAIGGHAAVAGEILEDVALARRLKAVGRKIRFRYGGDAVRTRMYRNFHQLREGWTKNLSLLFPNPGRLATKIIALWASAWIVLGIANIGSRAYWLNVAFFLVLGYLVARVRRSNFSWIKSLLGAIVGMPMFAYLLIRSKNAHAKGDVSWKGRAYKGDDRAISGGVQKKSFPSEKLA